MMNKRWVVGLKKVLWIGEKDARIYFFKGPNLTFGLFLPLVLYWAFSLNREVELISIIPGLIAIAIFFGAGAIQAISLPLERRTGTLHTMLAAPVTPLVIVLGKALAADVHQRSLRAPGGDGRLGPSAGLRLAADGRLGSDEPRHVGAWVLEPVARSSVVGGVPGDLPNSGCAASASSAGTRVLTSLA
ncbi:MAG: hypothetical protein ACLFV5_02925 [Anaerolineales bacterium]